MCKTLVVPCSNEKISKIANTVYYTIVLITLN